jgi:hypothetical protein
VKKIAENILLWLAVNVLAICVVVFVELSEVQKPSWWPIFYSIAINVLTGGLVSFFFYWLVVYLPEQRKRSIIKNSLLRTYKNIKRDILREVIFASVKGGRHDLQADTETIATLMSVDGFRRAFDGGRESDEGFYAFENQMSDDTPEFRAIILNFEYLAKQIEFVLHNYTMNDQKIFDFFKRLELILIGLRQASSGYDESKPLCRFIYEIFSGFSLIDGYRGYDYVEKMIKDI